MELQREGRKGREGREGKSIDFSGDYSQEIIGCGLRVHSALGPGLLESVYEECLCHELNKAGLRFRRQLECPIRYDNLQLGVGLRLDLLVEDMVIVEVKAVEALKAIHDAQLLTYLRLTGKSLGLLLNFNAIHFRHGIHRKVLS